MNREKLKKYIDDFFIAVILLLLGSVIGAITTFVVLSDYMEQNKIMFYVENGGTSRAQKIVDEINQKTKSVRVFVNGTIQIGKDYYDDLFYSEKSFKDYDRMNRIMDILTGNREPQQLDEASVLYDAIPLNFNYLPKADKKAYSASGTVLKKIGNYYLAITENGQMFKFRKIELNINNNEILMVGRLMGYDGNNIPLLRTIWVISNK